MNEIWNIISLNEKYVSKITFNLLYFIYNFADIILFGKVTIITSDFQFSFTYFIFVFYIEKVKFVVYRKRIQNVGVTPTEIRTPLIAKFTCAHDPESF